MAKKYIKNNGMKKLFKTNKEKKKRGLCANEKKFVILHW